MKEKQTAASGDYHDEITPGTDSVLGYMYMLLLSTVYWHRYEAGTRPLVPDELAKFILPTRKKDDQGALYQGEEFCHQFGLGPGNYHKYFDWVVSQREPDRGDELVEVLNAHMADLRRAMQTIKQDKQIYHDEIDLLNAFRLWHTGAVEGKPAKLDVIRKLLGGIKAFPKPALTVLRAEAGDPSEDIVAMKHVVKALTGKEGMFISMTDREKLRDSHPKEWAEYLAIKARLNKIYKTHLMNHIRDIGSPQPLDQVRKHMHEQGIPHALPPKEFKGLIGDAGELYTVHGSKLAGTPPAQDAKVSMNPNYDPAKDQVGGAKDNNFYAVVTNPSVNRNGKNNTVYLYTQEKVTANRKARFQLVSDLIDQEKKYVTAWRRDLRGKDIPKRILAAMCEITYLTALRVGGKGNGTVDEETFGLSTLTVGDVKKRGDAILLEYKGKKGVPQKHSISPATNDEKRVIDTVWLCAEGKRRADELWTYDGEVFNASKLNKYLKSVCSVPGATVHKLRHVRGTGIALTILPPLAEKLNKKRDPLTQTLVDAEFKKAMTQVGKLLGHMAGIDGAQKIQWSTAAKNYVDPAVIKDFFDEIDVKPSKTMEKFCK